MIVITLISTNWLTTQLKKIVQISIQTSQQENKLSNSLYQTLAALRGWVFISDEKFITERHDAWNNGIFPALKALKISIKKENNPFTIKNFNTLEPILYKLAVWQWIIEDVAKTPGNKPAELLVNKNIDSILNQIEQLEIGLIKTASEKNHKLTLATKGLRNDILKHYIHLLSIVFKKNEKIDEAPEIKKIDPSQLKFNDEQKSLYLDLKREIDNYKALSKQAIEISQSKKNNLSEYLLTQKAVPLARTATKLIKNLKHSQLSHLENQSKKLVLRSRIINATVFVFFATMVLIYVVIAYRTSNTLIYPIKELTFAANKVITHPRCGWLDGY